MLNRPNIKSIQTGVWLIAFGKGLFASAILSGCSVINIYDHGALAQTYYGLPIYTIDMTEPNKILFLQGRGVGIISGPTGYSIGYSKEIFLSIPPNQCTAVFINTSDETVSTLKSSLEAAGVDINTLCFYSVQGAHHE